MTWITDLATYLQNNSFGTVGTDIFEDNFRAGTQNSIILIAQPGLPQDATLNRDLILYKPVLGVKVRNKSGETAANKAKSIHDFLNLITNTRIGSTFFSRIVPIDREFFTSRDERDGTVYTINFNIEYNI
jgi:hypothetical protein